MTTQTYSFYQILMNVLKEMVDVMINAIIQMVHSYVLVERDICLIQHSIHVKVSVL